MLSESAITENYRCPGEPYSITEAVHLSRLAAFYPKCRYCPQAPGAESSANNAELIRPADFRIPELNLWTAEGVRGRYLNELTRPSAVDLAGAFASCVWEGAGISPAGPTAGDHFAGHRGIEPEDISKSAPWDGEGIRLLPSSPPGPVVVIAHDERPAAPDIVTGVGQSLRRMGCQVVDIGLSTRPTLLFAIEHLTAAGAIHVTGAGCDPGWIGLDFVHRDGIPCSNPGWLTKIDQRQRAGYSRPSRRPGTQRTFHAAVPYQAGLWKHFHALRPLKIALACSCHTSAAVFHNIFRKLACRLIPVDVPTRARNFADPLDPDVIRTAAAIRTASADLGLLVSDDGELCTVFDDRGAIVSPLVVARLLLDVVAPERSENASVIVPATWNVPPKRGRFVQVTEPNRERITTAILQERARLAADGHGRYWIVDGYPVCDALLTLVHLLHALSRSDTPFSQVVV
jgi:phosphomannomutase